MYDMILNVNNAGSVWDIIVIISLKHDYNCAVPLSQKAMQLVFRLQHQKALKSLFHHLIFLFRMPPTQLEDLQWHGEAGLFGAHQRPVAGAEILTWRQQQQHGDVISKL